MEPVSWVEVAAELEKLYDASARLEAIFPGRKFTLDGHHRDLVDDPDTSEYFVPVEWLDTVHIGQAINEIGLFGNQNTVCKPKTPKWRTTVDWLKEKLPKYGQEARRPAVESDRSSE